MVDVTNKEVLTKLEELIAMFNKHEQWEATLLKEMQDKIVKNEERHLKTISDLDALRKDVDNLRKTKDNHRYWLVLLSVAVIILYYVLS